MIPAIVKKTDIEHVFGVGGQSIRVFGQLDLEFRTLTASATLANGKPITTITEAQIKRELGQIYEGYSVILQY